MIGDPEIDDVPPKPKPDEDEPEPDEDGDSDGEDGDDGDSGEAGGSREHDVTGRKPGYRPVFDPELGVE
jgi:hypothetical protein